jgi:hypothetical protein
MILFFFSSIGLFSDSYAYYGDGVMVCTVKESCTHYFY